MIALTALLPLRTHLQRGNCKRISKSQRNDSVYGSVKIQQEDESVAPRFNINITNQLLLIFAENLRNALDCIAKSILKVSRK